MTTRRELERAWPLVRIVRDPDSPTLSVTLNLATHLSFWVGTAVRFIQFVVISWNWPIRARFSAWLIYYQSMWSSWSSLREIGHYMKYRLDPREPQILDGNEFISCSYCKTLTLRKYPNVCWLCKNHIYLGTRETSSVGLQVFYKYGTKLMTPEKMRQIEDAHRGEGAIDLLQPTRHYDKSNRKWYTNPDYVKHYGDPYASDTRK